MFLLDSMHEFDHFEGFAGGSTREGFFKRGLPLQKRANLSGRFSRFGFLVLVFLVLGFLVLVSNSFLVF